jgi:hydroxymethylbilane synthase
MRLGTRGSALALAQARWVAQRLGDDTEIVPITTLGDRGAAIEDKSRWTSELERALSDGRIDLAVHSAKDVPTDLGDGMELVAVPERADPRDALCGAASLAALAPGARVGTSSLRRAAQLCALRDDIEIVALRGNVETRLGKLKSGELDAMVLAVAGLTRLGREREIGAVLDLIPAPGQGALIVQACDGDDRFRHITDADIERCVLAERALASHLNASCATPLGARARTASGPDLTLSAWVGLPDGSHWIADALTAAADEVGPRVAERMLSAGARELLTRAQEMASV